MTSSRRTLYHEGLSYDTADRIISITRTETLDGSNADVAVETERKYHYDDFDQLNHAIDKFSETTWNVDISGNRISSTHRAYSQQEEKRQSLIYMPKSNKLLQRKENGADIKYQYDSSGNPTQIGGDSYIYGINNRLRYVKQENGTTAYYSYNAAGERIAKVIGDQLGTKVTIYYLYAAHQLISEADEYGRPTVSYIYLNRIPIAKLEHHTEPPLTLIPRTLTGLSARRSEGREARDTPEYSKSPQVAQLYAIFTDHLGTPIFAVDSQQTVVWRAQYDEYGQTINVIGGLVLNLRFPGQYFDQETRLHYNYFRNYSAETGRYIEPDPIGLGGGLKAYTYASNLPLSRIDPLGLRDVIVAIWTSRMLGYFTGSGSVGHVFVGELNGTALLSQFPDPHGIQGRNTTLSWQDTLVKENRNADYVYEVNVPDDTTFDAAVIKLQATPSWYFWPDGATSTQCASAASFALSAGGVKGISNANPQLPNYINTDLYMKSLFGSDTYRLPAAPW